MPAIDVDLHQAESALAISPTQFSDIPKSIQDIDIFVQNVYKYSDDVCCMLPLDEVLANMDILLQDIVRKASLDNGFLSMAAALK